MTEQAADRYDFRMEGSFDGGPWEVMETGTATRR